MLEYFLEGFHLKSRKWGVDRIHPKRTPAERTFSSNENHSRAGKMAQWGKAPVTKLDDMSWIPWDTHKGRKRSTPMSCTLIYTYVL